MLPLQLTVASFSFLVALCFGGCLLGLVQSRQKVDPCRGHPNAASLLTPSTRPRAGCTSARSTGRNWKTEHRPASDLTPPQGSSQSASSVPPRASGSER